jgi:hypothetical protein
MPSLVLGCYLSSSESSPLGTNKLHSRDRRSRPFVREATLFQARSSQEARQPSLTAPRQNPDSVGLLVRSITLLRRFASSSGAFLRVRKRHSHCRGALAVLPRSRAAAEEISRQIVRTRVVADMIFSPGDVLRHGGTRVTLCASRKPFRNPRSHTVVAFWGRILPFVINHRQPAKVVWGAFRIDKCSGCRPGTSPNRYLAS